MQQYRLQNNSEGEWRQVEIVEQFYICYRRLSTFWEVWLWVSVVQQSRIFGGSGPPTVGLALPIAIKISGQNSVFLKALFMLNVALFMSWCRIIKYHVFMWAFAFSECWLLRTGHGLWSVLDSVLRTLTRALYAFSCACVEPTPNTCEQRLSSGLLTWFTAKYFQSTLSFCFIHQRWFSLLIFIFVPLVQLQRF